MRIRPLHIVLAGMLAWFGTVHATEIIENDQDKSKIVHAQKLTFSGDTVVIKGTIGNVGFPKIPDLDFYEFFAQANDLVTLDIDGGYENGRSGSVDTEIAVFKKVDGNYRMLHRSDDVDPPFDEGSSSRFDPLLDEILILETGYYIVGVTSDPYAFMHGGITNPPFGSAFQQNGSYTLVISGVTSPVINIGIEIKPSTGTSETVQDARVSKNKADKRPPLNYMSKGKIPVALLSSSEFTAALVDQNPESLTFGRTGEEQSLSHCPNRRDVNRDGLLDLVCMFDAEAAGFEPDDTSGFLQGETVDGKKFKGRGLYEPVPRRR